LVLPPGVSDVLEPSGAMQAEQEGLPAYLARRRWFASKDEKITSYECRRGARCQRQAELLLTELEVALAREHRDVIFCPWGSLGKTIYGTPCHSSSPWRVCDAAGASAF